MGDVYDEIRVHDTFVPKELEFNGGETITLKMDYKMVERGNFLKAEIKSENDLVSGSLKTTEEVNVSFSPDHAHGDVHHIAFTSELALIEKSDGNVHFYKCSHAKRDDIKCVAFANFPLPNEGAHRFNQFRTFDGISTVWTCDPKECYILFVEHDGEIYKKDLPENT